MVHSPSIIFTNPWKSGSSEEFLSSTESGGHKQTAQVTAPPPYITGMKAVRECMEKHGIFPAELLPGLISFVVKHRKAVGLRPLRKTTIPLMLKSYPTKGLEIKDKSSNWGPMADFIPCNQRFSKNHGQSDNAIKSDDNQVKGAIENEYAIRMDLAVPVERLQYLFKEGFFGVRGKIGRSDVIEMFCEKDGEKYKFIGKLTYEGGDAAYKIFRDEEAIQVWGKVEDTKVLPQDEFASTFSRRYKGRQKTWPMIPDIDPLVLASHIERYGPKDTENKERSPSPAILRRVASTSSMRSTKEEADDYFGPDADKLPHKHEQSSVLSPGSPTELLSPHAIFRRRSSTKPFVRGRMGFASQSFEEHWKELNQALGRPPENPLVHHGAETANPNAKLKDATAGFFVVADPSREEGYFIAYADNIRGVEAILGEIKNMGFQYFINPEWSRTDPLQKSQERISPGKVTRNAFKEAQSKMSPTVERMGRLGRLSEPKPMSMWSEEDRQRRESDIERRLSQFSQTFRHYGESALVSPGEGENLMEGASDDPFSMSMISHLALDDMEGSEYATEIGRLSEDSGSEEKIDDGKR